uniref:Uncharacterized protein n=1 Tax=Acrobeloides nanus TaxID=290746 RepID=A0A914DM64_9BILA
MLGFPIIVHLHPNIVLEESPKYLPSHICIIDNGLIGLLEAGRIAIDDAAMAEVGHVHLDVCCCCPLLFFSLFINPFHSARHIEHPKIFIAHFWFLRVSPH